MQEIVSAIDVGTTKVCALMAAVTHDSLGGMALRLLGAGEAASRGIRRGVVMNVSEATDAIAAAVEACEHDAGQPMSSAYVGIAGSHINALTSHGMSPVAAGAIGHVEMQRALEGAQAVVLPQSQDVIHTIARSWTVDGQEEIFQPLGMNALRLEVDAHIVTGSRMAMSNLAQCVTANGIDVDELVLEPLASNKSVLTPDERKMGVAVVDMGGGTTDIAVFVDDVLCHTAILDVGGHHLTNDVAIGLHAPFETAEELKRRFGHALPERVAEDETVWANVFGEKAERSFSRQFICEILAARLEEIFELVEEELRKSGFRSKLPAGLVVTGGSGLLPGISELGRDIFKLPVRVGSPSSRLPITGLSRTLQSPTYATSVGLLLWGLHDDGFAIHRRFEAEPVMAHSGEWVGQATRWFKNLLPG